MLFLVVPLFYLWSPTFQAYGDSFSESSHFFYNILQFIKK